MGVSNHERRNRAFWDADADDYQAAHAVELAPARAKAWGAWRIPEAELRVLGEVHNRDVLEFGCGGAQWSIALAREGARPVGLDQSRAQLQHARRLQHEAAIVFPLVCASGEAVPLHDATFDIVFCDHGAMSFCDPTVTVPEVGRLLRVGGLLAFSKTTALRYLTWNDKRDRDGRRLRSDYFGMRVFSSDDGTVDFQMTYSEWIRLFRRCGLRIEDLIELRPPKGARTTYDFDYRWSRRWPAEEIWVARKT